MFINNLNLTTTLRNLIQFDLLYSCIYCIMGHQLKDILLGLHRVQLKLIHQINSQCQQEQLSGNPSNTQAMS